MSLFSTMITSISWAIIMIKNKYQPISKSECYFLYISIGIGSCESGSLEFVLYANKLICKYLSIYIYICVCVCVCVFTFNGIARLFIQWINMQSIFDG